MSHVAVYSTISNLSSFYGGKAGGFCEPSKTRLEHRHKRIYGEVPFTLLHKDANPKRFSNILSISYNEAPTLSSSTASVLSPGIALNTSHTISAVIPSIIRDELSRFRPHLQYGIRRPLFISKMTIKVPLST